MSDAEYREGGGSLPPYQEDFFQRVVNVSWKRELLSFSLGLSFSTQLQFGDYVNEVGGVELKGSLPIIKSSMGPQPEGYSEVVPYGKNGELAVTNTFSVRYNGAYLAAGMSYTWQQTKSGGKYPAQTFHLSMIVTIPEITMAGTPRQAIWSAAANLTSNKGGANKARDDKYGSPAGPIWIGPPGQETGPFYTIDQATATIAAVYTLDPPSITLQASVD